MSGLLRGIVMSLLLILVGWMHDPAAFSQENAKGKLKPPATAVEKPDPEGRWPKYKVGQPQRFIVWHDNDGWHVRTTSAARAIFTGTIKLSEGRIEKITGFDDLERARGKNTKDADFGRVNVERTRIDFRFVTNGKEDSFDFTVSEQATELEFTLRIDNAEQPEHVFIGKQGQHPKKASFKLPARPGRTKD
jgi:hypothetical protein